MNIGKNCSGIIHNDCSQSCVEVIFNFCPTWAEVGLWTSNQLGRKSFLFPTSCREVGFQNSVQLGQNYFFEIFSWNASKNAFLVGYHWERFFLKSLTKTPLPPATTWRIVLKIAAEARIKSLVSLATIWERLWTKYCSHWLPPERKFSCVRYECEYFFWRYMKIVFQSPLINRS